MGGHKPTPVSSVLRTTWVFALMSFTAETTTFSFSITLLPTLARPWGIPSLSPPRSLSRPSSTVAVPVGRATRVTTMVRASPLP
jgi:hypothetical protein